MSDELQVLFEAVIKSC